MSTTVSTRSRTALPAFADLTDLASERLGAAVIAANDEFFAPKEGLIKPGAPEWRAGVYTERGKWMDGWETRRRRTPGHDWAIVRMGVPGRVHGVVIDTAFYTGNYPESASIDGMAVRGVPTAAALAESSEWIPLLPQVALRGDSENPFAVDVSHRVTHLRLNIFPDGGVARLRVHGTPEPDSAAFAGLVDLAAMEHGGFVHSCSDMHYGHRQNLVLPGRSTHMGDGWETKRRRGPGHDWTIVRLAKRGTLERIELDTDHYRGNAPGRCSLEWCDAAGTGDAFDAAGANWHALLPETPVEPHARHTWETAAVTATHVRLNIFPDGGVARLRLFGRANDAG